MKLGLPGFFTILQHRQYELNMVVLPTKKKKINKKRIWAPLTAFCNAKQKTNQTKPYSNL